MQQYFVRLEKLGFHLQRRLTCTYGEYNHD